MGGQWALLMAPVVAVALAVWAASGVAAHGGGGGGGDADAEAWRREADAIVRVADGATHEQLLRALVARHNVTAATVRSAGDGALDAELSAAALDELRARHADVRHDVVELLAPKRAAWRKRTAAAAAAAAATAAAEQQQRKRTTGVAPEDDDDDDMGRALKFGGLAGGAVGITDDHVLDDDWSTEAPQRYHTHAELEHFLDLVRSECSHIARVGTIGQSALGRDIYVVKMSDNPDLNEPGEPEMKVVAGMHGNEAVGREIAINLIRYLCRAYSTRSRVRALVNALDIWIMPSYNPDGGEAGRKTNANGVDLDNDFPDQFELGAAFDEEAPPLDDADVRRREPETRAVIEWHRQRTFVGGVNLHGGALAVVYPFDGNARHVNRMPSPTRDQDVFVAFAERYARAATTLREHSQFAGGVTNGAAWSLLYGTYQDFAYLWAGSFDLTIEASAEKWPDAAALPTHWHAHREALLRVLSAPLALAVRGVVMDAETSEPLRARVYVEEVGSAPSRFMGHWVKTDGETGDYTRLALKGVKYYITAVARGYDSQTKTLLYADDHSGPLTANFLLERSLKL